MLKEFTKERCAFSADLVLAEKTFDDWFKLFTTSDNTVVDTETEFCVIFEEGVSPSWTVSSFVCAPWVEWICSTSDKVASCSSCKVKAVAEELCKELHDGWFTASWACTIEFKKW